MLGYRYATDFLAGNTFNTSRVSWTGFHGNFSFNDTLNFLYKPHLKGMKILPKRGNVTKRFLIPMGICYVYLGSHASMFEITVPRANETIELYAFVSDPALANHFQLPYALSVGDKIVVRQYAGESSSVEYNIKLKETRVETNDATCVEYPDGDVHTYSDCIDAEIRNMMLPVLGCMVPWISSTGNFRH